jgi:CRP-like cAMP-binding protein
MKEQTKTIYKAGSYIYIEGDEDVEDVYIVDQGLVEFKSSTKRVRSHGSLAEKGDVFGSISCLSKRPRMETAFAKVNTSIITFTREKFLSVLQKNSEIAIKLLDSFADELRLYDTMIFSVGIKKNVFQPEDIQLFELGRHYYKSNMIANASYVLNRYRELYPKGSNFGAVREMLNEIEKKGLRKTPGPILDGIYRRYSDKQIIFCENEPGDDLFIIKKGKVKIVKIQENSEMILSVLSEGEIFGELAIVSDKPRNASAISFGSTILLPINKDSLMKLIQKSSDILKRIFTAISQRVWFTFIRMEAKFFEKPTTRIYVFLENKLIEDNISQKSKEQHIFNFGIDELIRMSNIPNDKIPLIMNELTQDHNLEFNIGQTIIDNPSLVSSKARYYRSRDRLYDVAEKLEKDHGGQYHPYEPAVDQLKTTDHIQPANPTLIKNHPKKSGSLYEELDSEIESNN